MEHKNNKTTRSKVAIIGAGNVGSTFAFCLMIRGVDFTPQAIK